MRDYFLRCQMVWRRIPCRLFLASTCAALLGIAAGRNLIGPVYLVSGSSMSPTYQEGSMIHTIPVSGSLERGDIVVLDDRKGDYALKRIVGLPGETVHIWRGYVFINKKILIEPYLAKQVYTFPRQRAAVFVLGEGQFFVLGDNRPSSADSRLYGPVERKQVKKRVMMPDTAVKARFGPIRIPTFDNAALRLPVPKLS